MLRLAGVLVAAAAASTGAAATPSVERPVPTWTAVWNGSYAGLCATDLHGHAFRVSDPKTNLPDEPLWSPDGRWIALTRGSDVYVTDAQGRHRRKLTDSNPEYAGFYAADWSPDGGELLIHHGARALYSRLFLVKRDGTHARTLVDGQSGGAPAGSGSWSPDGRRILFSMDGALQVIETDGANRRTLVDHAFGGIWSPDGRQFAYIAANRFGSPEGLGVAQADGTGAHVLASGQILAAAWSPDGQQLVYIERRPTQLDLRVVHTDGSGGRLLAEGVGWGGLIGGRWSPAWSPDGTAILFARGQWPSGRVALINPDGTAERTVATGGFGAFNPVWRLSAPLPSDRRPCRIRGSSRDDVIRGTDRGDLITGSAGSDTISGAGGDDVIIGGRGRDRLYGGPGDDFFRTRDRARDFLFGGLGRDGAYFEGLDRLESIEVKRR
jgi:hypothetical protein